MFLTDAASEIQFERIQAKIRCQVAVSNIYSAVTSDGRLEKLQQHSDVLKSSSYCLFCSRVSSCSSVFSCFGSAADVCELWSGGHERVYRLSQGQLLLHLLSEEGKTNPSESKLRFFF